MKIACITTSQIPSSTANSMQVMKVCQALAQVGGAVHLWAPGTTPHAWEELAEHYGLTTPFEVQWVPSIRALRRYDFALHALDRARAWGADLVYTWLAQAALFGGLRGLPVVMEVHDRPTGSLGPFVLGQFLRLHSKKRTLVITRALQALLERTYGFTFAPDEIAIAPNGADLERYEGLPCPSEARRQLGLHDVPTAVYTGHFYAGRGMGLLFELAKRLPDANFLWVGGRPEDVEQWREKLRDAGVSNVLLTGFVENSRLPLYQSAGDVLLMPYERSIAGSSGGNSADICSPMKMFEYMAAGRAILASDLPVLHEVLNAENAVFAAPEDVSAWERSLASLLADESRREQLSRQARADVAQFTWKSRAEKALAGFA